jgi:hypothetical protein
MTLAVSINLLFAAFVGSAKVKLMQARTTHFKSVCCTRVVCV